MWRMLEGEYFIDNTTGEAVKGPLLVRVDERGGHLLSIQGAEKRYEVTGDDIKDFERVVQTKPQ